MSTNHCGQDGIEELHDSIAERDEVIARLGTEVSERRRQLDLVTGALENIKHSMRQAQILGNDKAREIHLSFAIADAALAALHKPAGSPAGEGGE